MHGAVCFKLQESCRWSCTARPAALAGTSLRSATARVVCCWQCCEPAAHKGTSRAVWVVPSLKLLPLPTGAAGKFCGTRSLGGGATDLLCEALWHDRLELPQAGARWQLPLESRYNLLRYRPAASAREQRSLGRHSGVHACAAKHHFQVDPCRFPCSVF